ncbi:hypothetical protein [Streptomyces sp. NPDC049887]|uniref:hypothetical protein n=1 Tax=Streptomyces sp. NPDC049887 TaxID=3155654 RepID=UPI003412053B
MLLSCRPGPGGAGSESPQTPRENSLPPAHGPLFLGPGSCSGRGPADAREVPCTSEKAVARVTARHDGRRTDTPVCPDTTDFVLHISEHRPAFDEDGDGSIPRGYACMRNLEPPHPGDPGGGGGPHTIVGDCLRTSRQGQVKETACGGSGEHRPEFRVASTVDGRSQCPPSTDLFVELPAGSKAVGCARRL